MSFLVLGTSIALQLIAAVLALRLIRVTGVLAAWLLIASALILMALRRSIIFFELVVADTTPVFNVAAEITALFGVDHAKTLAVVQPAVWKVRRENKKVSKMHYGNLGVFLSVIGQTICQRLFIEICLRRNLQQDINHF